MSSDPSGSFTPVDSESKTFSGTGTEAGPGWDTSGTFSYDLPSDLALPQLEEPSLGSGQNEQTPANWPFGGFSAEKATYKGSMGPPPPRHASAISTVPRHASAISTVPRFIFPNDSLSWYRETDNFSSAASSPGHGDATGASTPYESDVSSLEALPLPPFPNFPSYPSLEPSSTADFRLNHAVSYMRVTQGSGQPSIGSASAATSNDMYGFAPPSASERASSSNFRSHPASAPYYRTYLNPSVPPQDGPLLLAREPTQPPASPIEYKFTREWTAPPAEVPSNDHREVQSAPPETVALRRKGKRKAEDLDESLSAAAPGPSAATAVGPRDLRQVKAERARVRRSGEKRSEGALREAVAEYLSAKQVTAHVSKQKLEAYAVEYIQYLRNANLAWETEKVYREKFLRDALSGFVPPDLDQSVEEFAVDLIKRQRREIDELREQALDQRMLNQYPQDAESVRDTILRYQGRIAELQERLGM